LNPFTNALAADLGNVPSSNSLTAIGCGGISFQQEGCQSGQRTTQTRKQGPVSSLGRSIHLTPDTQVTPTP
jgi:hypothetical protein